MSHFSQDKDQKGPMSSSPNHFFTGLGTLMVAELGFLSSSAILSLKRPLCVFFPAHEILPLPL